MSENKSWTIKKIIFSSASQTSVSANKAQTSKGQSSISSTPNCVQKLVKTSSHPEDLPEINLELRRTLSNNTLDKDLNLSQELQNNHQ